MINGKLTDAVTGPRGTPESRSRAEVVSRLHHVCNKKYNNDRHEMAKVLQISAGVLRDVFRGKLVSDDAFESVVSKVGGHRGVSINWLRTGQGEPFMRPGLLSDYIASESSPEPTKVCTETPAPKEFTVASTVPTPAANGHRPVLTTVVPEPCRPQSGIDLFVELAGRIAALERNTGGATLSSLNNDIVWLKNKVEAEATVRKQQHQELASVVAALKSELAEAKRVNGRLESAMIAIRSELDAAKSDLAGVIGAVTAPATPMPVTPGSKATRRAREEDRAPEELMTGRQYVALVGAIPERLKAANIKPAILGQYLSLYEAARGFEPAQQSSGRRNEYRVESYRAFARYMETKNWDVDAISVRDFVAHVSHAIRDAKP